MMVYKKPENMKVSIKLSKLLKFINEYIIRKQVSRFANYKCFKQQRVAGARFQHCAGRKWSQPDCGGHSGEQSKWQCDNHLNRK